MSKISVVLFPFIMADELMLPQPYVLNAMKTTSLTIQLVP